MPKYKRRYRKKRNRTLNKLKKDVKWLKKGIEFKHKDVALANQTVWTTAQYVICNALSEGHTEATRVGHKVHANSVKIRGYIRNDSVVATTPTDGIARLMLVRWKNPQGGTIDMNQILQNSTNNNYTVISHRAYDEGNDYQVYFDHTFTYDTTQHSYIPFKINQKLNNVVEFNAGTAVEASFNANSLYLIFLGSEATEVDAPHVYYDIRFTYTDA